MNNREYLFVYGIFRDCANNLLGDAVFCDKSYVYGKLYRVNDFYPGCVLESCNNKIWGDVYLVDPSVFPELDEFEGVEYHRRKIHTSIGEDCWIYEFVDDVSNYEEISVGDWILRDNHFLIEATK